MTWKERFASRFGITWSREIVITVGVGLLLGGGLIGWRLSRELRRLRTQQATAAQRTVSAEERSRAAEQQRQELQQKYEELSRQYQQLSVDRDNLFTQAKRGVEVREHAEAEREQLEQGFQQAARERLEFKQRVIDLEEGRGRLLADNDALLKERDRLQSGLAKAKSRSEEKRLKDVIAKEERERRQLAERLQKTQQEASRFKAGKGKAEQDVTALRRQLEPLQEKYAKLLSDYRTVKRKTERMPGNVTDLAREHERLIHELADTHYNMGVALTKRNDYVRAANEFRKTIELRPDDPEAHYNLGVIYAEHLPDRERAIAFFRKYLAINPKGESANWARQYIATWQAWEAKERLE